MQTMSIEQAESHLAEIIEKLTPGEVVMLTRGDKPVARIVAEPSAQPHPVPGRGKGMLTVISDDDEHLKDFAEYLP
jgi:antitoxin (DNA-binding transcriptional repressor) of toxin-antitoxin stability system